MVVIEMNPRVSRSSALASKATGFPIAKIAAKLAVGYLLDEIRNDITRETPASFEPTIDYVVTKIPGSPSRSSPRPTPPDHPDEERRRSHGHRAHLQGKPAKMPAFPGNRPQRPRRRRQAVARRQRTLRGSRYPPRDLITRKLSLPNAERIFFIRHACRAGFTLEEIFSLTKIDRWFLTQMKEIVDFEEEIARSPSGLRHFFFPDR
jgi:carbamoyl-phosphate synthase large subunit